MATPEVGEEAFAVVITEQSDVTWYGDEREAVEDALSIVNASGGRLAIVKIVGWVAPPPNSARYLPVVPTPDGLDDLLQGQSPKDFLNENFATGAERRENGEAPAPENKNPSEDAQTPATVVSEPATEPDWTKVAHPFENDPSGLWCLRCNNKASDPLHGKSYPANRQTVESSTPLRSVERVEVGTNGGITMRVEGKTDAGVKVVETVTEGSLPFDAPQPLAPKHPAFRGVDLPAHWNVTATEGDAGPSTAEQHALIAAGFAATNTKMEPTLRAIVADDVTLKALNYGTAEAILKILNSIKR
jgi:hypothetical protein